MAKGGDQGQQGNHSEMTFILCVALIMVLAWLVWTLARPAVVFPLLALDWVEYRFLHAIHMLDDTGEIWMRWCDQVLRRNINTYRVTLADLGNVQSDVGMRLRIPIAATMVVMAFVILFRMKGEGFRVYYTLTGRGLSNVVRFASLKMNDGFLRRLVTGKFKFFLFRWLSWPHAWLLRKTGVVKSKKEWVRNGASLAHYQAQHWKIALPGAYFDPELNNPAENPQLNPMEWLRDNKVRVDKREGPDVEAMEKALQHQLGPTWQGVEKAPYYCQAICVLSALNVKRDQDNLEKVRDGLNEIHVLKAGQAEKLTRKLIAPFLADEKIVERINHYGSKHAFLNTAMIGIYGWGGPMATWGGRGPILNTAMFRWLKPLDRTLWYCLNNVGRYKFHVEAAGAIGHFLAERVLRTALQDPYTQNSADGILIALEERGVEDLDTYFREDKDF